MILVFECTRRSEFEAFGPLGRVKCPVVWQPEDKTAKVVYTTEGSGMKEEVVPQANHFVLEINHFNKVALNQLEQKLDMNDAFWNAKTLEGIEKSIVKHEWVKIIILI
ncbi:MAG: hypothetical protein ACJZ16_03815 [Methylophilaceae bacterium]